MTLRSRFYIRLQLGISGPMGTLSQPEVRNQLRSLLGAYWGSALTKPSTLAPLGTDTSAWMRGGGLTGTIEGGVVIPAGTNSTAAAVWSQGDNNRSAVVTTDQSTFFGWHWGADDVAPAAIDNAWLRAALRRYGLTATAGAKTPNQSPQYCAPSQTARAIRPAIPLPNPQQQNSLPRLTPSTPGRIAQTDPDFGVAPALPLPTERGPITAPQATAMGRELENLIGRFESTRLAANATNSNVNLQTGAAIEQFLVATAKNSPRPENAQTSTQPVATNSAT